MYIVHYILGSTNHWKMFNDYQQAWDFMEYQDKPLKIIKFCPTSSEPQIIWWNGESKPNIKTECDYGMTLEQAGIEINERGDVSDYRTKQYKIDMDKYATGETKAVEPLVMPANEMELIVEEAISKVQTYLHSLIKGLAEQFNRIGGK